jgi:hypothetical protein
MTRTIPWAASFLLVVGCFPSALGGASENHLKSGEATRGNPGFQIGVVYKLSASSGDATCKYDHGFVVVKFQTAKEVKEEDGRDIFNITYLISKDPGTRGIAETVQWDVRSRHYDEDGKEVNTIIGDDNSSDQREEVTGRGNFGIPHNPIKLVSDGELLFPGFRPVNVTCF